jgi:uncharacterized coiled-coil protein SlyX
MSETQPEAPAQPAAPPPAQPSSIEERMAALEARAAAAEARAHDLARQLAEQAQEAEQLVVKTLPEHWLHLANGDVVESAGAIPTHVDTGDENTPQLVPVVHAFDR